jgi:hypothetical protein
MRGFHRLELARIVLWPGASSDLEVVRALEDQSFTKRVPLLEVYLKVGKYFRGVFMILRGVSWQISLCFCFSENLEIGFPEKTRTRSKSSRTAITETSSSSTTSRRPPTTSI